jgi:hypothetical protein
MQLYTIDPGKANHYVARELKKMLNTIGIVFSSIVFVLLLIAVFTEAYILFPIAIVVFVCVYFFVGAMFKDDLRTMTKALYFKVDKDSISREVDQGKLTALQRIRAERANARYGASISQTIQFDQIESTEVSEHEVVIRAMDLNSVNENGLIRIPSELGNFNEIRAIFMSDPQRFKVKTV